MKQFLRNNGLSIVFFLMFLFSILGQFYTGWIQNNEELNEKGQPKISLSQYVISGLSIEATFENWESEFLQMALFVVLSACFYQKGSSESKDPDGENSSDKKPNPRKKDAPWPVKKGGLILTLYSNSLSIALFALFLASFLLHWFGSLKHYNLGQSIMHKPTETAYQYLSNSKFWFESFQNWQSEFLSVLAIVILSIFLRQKNSAQSKPVDAPDFETGE
jgi:hypothetical protein